MFRLSLSSETKHNNMGVGQSQVEVDYEAKLFTKLGALKQNKAIMPLAAAVVMYQIKDLTPADVDLSRADAVQTAEFAKMTYDENTGQWFYDGDCNNVDVLLDQVTKIVDELDCNKWFVLYTFIRFGYDVALTSEYCRANKVNKKTPVFNITREKDVEGWRVMYEKILELENVELYEPPADYKITRRRDDLEQLDDEETTSEDNYA